MANSLNQNINDKLMRAFIPAFESQRSLSKTVSTNAKNLVEAFDETTGGTRGAVRMKRPLQFKPQRTADGDFTGKEMNPLNVGTVPAEVGDYCTVFVSVTDVERALESADVAQTMNEIIAPAAEDMCNEIESELGNRMMLEAAHASGDPTKAITAWDDIAKAGALLKSIGLPGGSKFCAINNFDELALAGEQKGLAVNPEVGNAVSSATIASRFAGFDSVFTSDNMPSFVSGDISTGITVKTAPTQTYDSIKGDYRQQLVLTATDGADKTIKAGTTLIIQGVNLVHLRNHKKIRGVGGAFLPLTVSVLEDATFSGTDVTVNVSGAAVFEDGVNGAYNTIDTKIVPGAAVVIKEEASKDYSPGLAYHQAFYGMGSIKLPKLDATDSSFTTKDGLNFRVTKFSDGTANAHKIRIDFRPTFACLNPFFASKVYGNI